MPVSGWHYTTPILDAVAALNAERPILSVLDVGCGAGKWGFLLRDVLDWYQRGVYWRDQWVTRIEGIEVFDRYHSPVHDYVYDAVHWGDARQLLPTLPRFDLVVAMEIIEHLEKDEGRRFLRTLVEKAGRAVILSFPPEVDALGRHVLEQGATHGNEHERHRAVWREDDLRGFRYRTLDPFCFLVEPEVRAARVVRAEDLVEREGGARVLVSERSRLVFEVEPRAQALLLDVLHHPWSGTLVARDDRGRVLAQEDLFAERGEVVRLRVAVGSDARTVELRVLPSPRSQGTEAWVKFAELL